MTKDEINTKLTRLAGKQQCTNKYCATKNIDYTRSFDACISLINKLQCNISLYKVGDKWTCVIDYNGLLNKTSKYPVYALALTLAQISE